MDREEALQALRLIREAILGEKKRRGRSCFGNILKQKRT